MKSKLLKLTASGTLMIAFVLQSCIKDSSTRLTTQENFSNNSLIRVFVATVNSSRNYVYVDANPVTGALLSSGGMFPAAGIYASNIPAGVRAFLVRDTSSTTTQVPLSFAENMQVNKNYTIFLYDTITSPKQKTVETKYVVSTDPTDTSCSIRFANFIYNPNIVPAIDIFSFNKNTNIFTNVAVTDVTDFIKYPTTRLLVDTLYIRETGSSTNIIKVVTGGVFQQKRNYTLVYRGSHRGTRVATLYTDR